MSMTQNIGFVQGHNLVMTPLLQQAIKLLELSNMELSEFVETELEKNPLLQRENQTEDSIEAAPAAAQDAALSLSEPGALSEARDNLDAPSEDAYAADSPSERADMEQGPSGAIEWSAGRAGGGQGDYDLEAFAAAPKSLHEHLEAQLQLSAFSPSDRFIAMRLIGEVEDDGYFRADLNLIACQLNVPACEIERVLGLCQQFEPTGVMARDLRECLMLQLRENNRFDPAMAAMLDNLKLIARGEFDRLREACGVSREDLAEMLAELRDLSPRPGSAFAPQASPAVTPDVMVRELAEPGAYSVELNSETMPRLIFDRAYYAEVSKCARSPSDKSFVAECNASANWLIKSLDQRARTILKVSEEIVRQQREFLAHGAHKLRPLTMKAVADEVGLHESTVSRVTSNKYMATPRGLFELKYFFSPAISSTPGHEAHSAEAVRTRIKAMIGAEPPNGVLSDDSIVEMLRGEGVDIARRTVAKYRESLNIPSSIDRRRRLARNALANSAAKAGQDQLMAR